MQRVLSSFISVHPFTNDLIHVIITFRTVPDFQAMFKSRIILRYAFYFRVSLGSLYGIELAIGYVGTFYPLDMHCQEKVVALFTHL